MAVFNSLRTDLPLITYETLAKDLIHLFEKQNLTHLPILHNELLVGMLPKESILESTPQDTVASLSYDLERYHVLPDVHWQEALETFGKFDTNILPVTDEKNQYLGYFSLIDFIHLFSETPFLKELGSFIVLERNDIDYSLSEISQIVESNQAKILGAFVSDMTNGKVQITLKIFGGGLSEILQTFRRYGYTIVLQKEDDLYLNQLKENSDYFEKYLTL